MANRGVLFALSDAQAERLQAASHEGDAAVIDCIASDIEEEWEEGFVCETDKAWDAIHRCLTNGKPEWDNGEYPLKLCILSGIHLTDGDSYIASVTAGQQVQDVADALKDVTREKFRATYDLIDPEDYQFAKSEEDFEYAWGWFQHLPEFWQRAAAANRDVIFTVDY